MLLHLTRPINLEKLEEFAGAASTNRQVVEKWAVKCASKTLWYIFRFYVLYLVGNEKKTRSSETL